MRNSLDYWFKPDNDERSGGLAEVTKDIVVTSHSKKNKNSKELIPSKKSMTWRRILWFMGLYFASLLVIGLFMLGGRLLVQWLSH